MQSILAYPDWKDLYDKVIGNHLDVKSAWIVHAPYYFGLDSFFECFKELKNNQHKIIAIDLGEIAEPNANRFDKSLKKFHTELKSFVRAENREIEGLTQELLKLVNSTDAYVLFVIKSSQDVKLTAELLDAFWHAKIKLKELKGKLKILALDDYSLFYYDRWTSFKFNRSLRDYFVTCEIDLADRQNIKAYFKNIKLKYTEELIENIFELTGGNCGLVLTLAELIQEDTNLKTKGEIRKRLHKSEVLQYLRDYLHRNFSNDTGVINKFAHKDVPNHDPTPAQQDLHRLGILRRDGITSTLYNGLISELVNELNSKTESETTLNRATRKDDPITSDEDSFIILHISDIHVDRDFPFVINDKKATQYEFRRDIAKILKSDLMALGLNRVDTLIISGDFTNYAEMDEFRESHAFINYLLTDIGLSHKNLVITAGNHDISWNTDHYANGTTRINFSDFKSKYLGLGEDTLCELIELKSKSLRCLLRILVLDSNLVEGKLASGIGFVSPMAFQLAEQKLKESNTSGFKNVFNVLVIHHHVFPVTSLEPKQAANKDVSIIGNAAQLIEFCGKHNFNVVLHGHQHKPCISDVNRWISGSVDKFVKILCLGAGSFSGQQKVLTPYNKNHYFLVKLSNNSVVVKSRVLEAGDHSFTTDGDFIFLL